MDAYLKPTEAEIEFLNLAYNKFYDIFEETFEDAFWEETAYYRLTKIKTAFEIYAEILHYEPIKWIIESMKRNRPPMEAEVASDLFKCIRNIFAHFPFFESWDEVIVNKNIINWHKKGQTIDKFLEKYKGRESVKYRIWEEKKKKMTYLSISFPNIYDKHSKVYLKEILSEKEGFKFALILMKKIIDTQIAD